MKITLVQSSPSISRKNLPEHIETIKNLVESNDLIIFPELSLNGYMMMDSVFDQAFKIEELEALKQLSSDVDIIVGCALWKESAVYNTGVVFSRGELKHIHYKNILPNYGMFEEARYFFTGEGLRTFQLGEKKAALAICEDVWNSTFIDQMVKLKPDLVIVISNSPARGFNTGTLQIKEQWDSILKTISLYCGAYVLYANRVGFEDGVGFWGGSKALTPQGKVLAEAPLFEETQLSFNVDKKLTRTQKYLIRT